MMCDLSLAEIYVEVNATLTTHRVDDVPHEQVVDTVAVVKGSVWRNKRGDERYLAIDTLKPEWSTCVLVSAWDYRAPGLWVETRRE